MNQTKIIELIKSANHDNQAEKYDENIARDVLNNDYIREKYFELHDRIIQLANINENISLLDIGIGTGLLEEKINGLCRIYGIDISENMLLKLNEKKLMVETKKGSINNIPFESGKFDVIVSCFTFHHLTDDEKLNSLYEMNRVLKMGGVILLGDFMYENENSLNELKIRFVNENRTDMLEELEVENFTNIEILNKWFNEIGFKLYYERVSTISWITLAGKH